jgi:hypothetical protein
MRAILDVVELVSVMSQMTSFYCLSGLPFAAFNFPSCFHCHFIFSLLFLHLFFSSKIKLKERRVQLKKQPGLYRKVK